MSRDPLLHSCVESLYRNSGPGFTMRYCVHMLRSWCVQDHTLVSDLKQAMSSVSFGSSFPTVKENQPARMRNSSARQENDSMATEAEQQAINLQTLLAQAGATARIRGPAGSQIRKTGIPQQMNHTGRVSCLHISD